MKHFLDISDFSRDQLDTLVADAKRMKQGLAEHGPKGAHEQPLQGRILAMIFDKPSTRTRVSFDVAMRQLGGETLVLSAAETQLGRGESVADTAKVLSRYVDAIMIRTDGHDKLAELAAHATVPVINGLTDRSHPCQIMADVMTYEERRGTIAGATLAWTGDGNNVLHSFIEASAVFGFSLNVAAPDHRRPDPTILAWGKDHGAQVTITSDPAQAVAGADCVVTDTWVSMGAEDAADGHNTFKPYQVNRQLMAHAKPDALFMHCLPAHRGHEVTDEVIDGPNSVVFDEAENRLHVQKAILAWCLAKH